MCRHVRQSKHNSFRGGALLKGITAGHVAVCWRSSPLQFVISSKHEYRTVCSEFIYILCEGYSLLRCHVLSVGKYQQTVTTFITALVFIIDPG